MQCSRNVSEESICQSQMAIRRLVKTSARAKTANVKSGRVQEDEYVKPPTNELNL